MTKPRTCNFCGKEKRDLWQSDQGNVLGCLECIEDGGWHKAQFGIIGLTCLTCLADLPAGWSGKYCSTDCLLEAQQNE